jgi:hypothetical protein
MTRSPDPADLPLDPSLRMLGKVLHERYTLAARIARATWPAAETSPEAMVAAAATVFIAMNQQLGRHTAPGVDRPPAAVERPPCPKCGTVMQPVPKKSAKTPDFRCPDRACDTPLWLRRNGAHP